LTRPQTPDREEKLTVDQYSYLPIVHRVYGKGIREISRDTGHSKNTVKKALREEYGGCTARSRPPFPALGPYLANIDRWRKEDKDQPRKQAILQSESIPG
jgi:hypothetical protein